MIANGLVPVYNHHDPELAKQVMMACYHGGARLFEFTNRGNHAHEVFGILHKFAAAEAPDLILGAGSIVDEATAALFIQLGARFIVSPQLNPAMARVCNRRKILWLPGCATPSEIAAAEELGAEIVKIFPAAQLGGPDFVRAVLAPCPWSHLMPTRGVAPTEANLRDWFAAGVACVGMGSNLITKEIEQQGNFAALELKVRQTLTIITACRSQ